MKLRCTSCGHVSEAPPENRCPSCLRRKLVPFEPSTEPPSTSARWLALVVAWVVALPLSWLMLEHRVALERHHLGMSSLVLSAALTLLPARLALSRALASAGLREAFRALAWTWAASLWLAVCVALAMLWFADVVAGLALALPLFLAPFLLLPPLLAARKTGQPLLPAFGVGMLRWSSVVLAVLVVMGLQVLRAPAPKPTIVLPSPGLIETLEAKNVTVTLRWEGETLQLRTDTQRLSDAANGLLTHLPSATDQVKAAPNANGLIVWCLDPLFQRANQREQLDFILKQTNQGLAASKTRRGSPLSLTIRFDCPQ